MRANRGGTRSVDLFECELCVSVYRSVDCLQINAFSVLEMEMPKLLLLNWYIHIYSTYVDIPLHIFVSKAYENRPRDPSRIYVYIPFWICIESLRK